MNFVRKNLLIKLLVYSIIGVTISDCSCFSGSNKPKIELRETKDPALAILIYNQYGTSLGKTHVCESIDGVTNRVYGIPICKRVAENLQLSAGERVMTKCVLWINLPKNIYEHGHKTVDEKTIKNCVAKCIYGAGEMDYFYITNAKNDYYYVFQPKLDTTAPGNLKKLEMRACLKIPLKASDFPPIILEATNDPNKADSMFGIFKTPSKKRKNHICNVNTSKESKILTCEKVLSQRNRSVMKNVMVVCEKLKITRPLIRNGEFEKSRSLYAAKCCYSDSDFPKTIMIFNTPKNNLYYVAEMKKDDKNWIIFSTVQIK